MIKIRRAIYFRSVTNYEMSDEAFSITGIGTQITTEDAAKMFKLFGREYATFFQNRVPSKEYSVSGKISGVDVITGPLHEPTEFGVFLEDGFALYFKKGRSEFQSTSGYSQMYEKLYNLVRARKIRMSGDMLNCLAFSKDSKL